MGEGVEWGGELIALGGEEETEKDGELEMRGKESANPFSPHGAESRVKEMEEEV